MTGFRVALGGAQEHYDVLPDLTTLGKVIGGGLPVGAFGGRADILDHIAPSGPVYQAGTLSGNPVAMAAGFATLDLVSQPGFFEALSGRVERLTQGVLECASAAGVPLSANCAGGMFGFFFTEEQNVRYFQQVMDCSREHFNAFFQGMLAEGIYLAPSAFEAGFVSSAHGDLEIDKTLEAAEKIFKKWPT